MVFAGSCKDKEAPILPEVEAPPKFAELTKADWLLGKWENNSDRGNLSEIWTRKNDSVFSGRTYFVMGTDTAFTESIELVESKGKLVYSATISDQNQGKPVLFPATKADKERLIFENVQHDFPKKISYNRISADSIMAEVSGIEGGKQKSDQFGMRRAR